MPILRSLCMAFLITFTAQAVSTQQAINPEDLAGRWEAPDGKGGAVGMNILISTTVPHSAVDLVNTPQTTEVFQVALYQREGADVRPLGFNGFSTSPKGGASWDGRELRINFQTVMDLPEVHVKLAWSDKSKVWTGVFERGEYRNSAITLRRPAAQQQSLFVGTWFDGTNGMNNCLHIAQSQDGTFTAWGDDLQVPGHMRYSNGIQPPERAFERYGEIAKVNVTGADRIAVEMRAYTGICCSHPFAARRSSDANSLNGEWVGGPNQVPRPAKWIRMQGVSCRSAASRR